MLVFETEVPLQTLYLTAVIRVKGRSSVTGLFGSSKGVVKAGDVGHDGAFIGLGGVDDICKNQQTNTVVHVCKAADFTVTIHFTFRIQHFGNVQVFFGYVKSQV